MTNEPDFYETWKAIAGAVGRSERWCRYTTLRAADPLPVFKVGGIVRLNTDDLEAWIARQRAGGVRQAPPSGRAAERTAACPGCGTVVVLRVDNTMRKHKVPGRSWDCSWSKRSPGVESTTVTPEIKPVSRRAPAPPDAFQAELGAVAAKYEPLACVDCRRVHLVGGPCPARDDDGYF